MFELRQGDTVLICHGKLKDHKVLALVDVSGNRASAIKRLTEAYIDTGYCPARDAPEMAAETVDGDLE